MLWSIAMGSTAIKRQTQSKRCPEETSYCCEHLHPLLSLKLSALKISLKPLFLCQCNPRIHHVSQNQRPLLAAALDIMNIYQTPRNVLLSISFRHSVLQVKHTSKKCETQLSNPPINKLLFHFSNVATYFIFLNLRYW